jgi:VIT1/CCC1 family predicted Fe2+/Mn2+ transporter
MVSDSFRTGVSFGLTSGVITTLGLMVGLESGTSSKVAVLGGILTIAVADAFADALGIHISEESENVHTTKEIWESTIVTFVAKFAFASIFIVPVLLLDLRTAVIASIVLGLSIIAFASWRMARRQGTKPWKVIGEHLLIAITVIVITHYIGVLVAEICG